MDCQAIKQDVLCTINSNDHEHPFKATFWFSQLSPFTVTILFSHPSGLVINPRGDTTMKWELGAGLFLTARDGFFGEMIGEGDVRLCRDLQNLPESSDDTGSYILWLEPPDGAAQFRLEADSLESFLRNIEPFVREASFGDLDQEWASLR